MSSTYFQSSMSLFNGFKSVTITKKKIGPSFVPRGTPAVTFAQFETDLPSLTLCFRSERKLHIQGIKEVLTPVLINFDIKTFKLIQWDPLLKSRKIILIELPCLLKFDNH